MGNCLVTKLYGVVNNPALPKFGEVVFELIGEPGANPRRSGAITNKDNSQPVTVRILNDDETVVFSNGRGRSFVVNNNDSNEMRSLGTNKDTKVGVYPGNAFTLDTFSEHHDGIHSSIANYDNVSVKFMYIGDPTSRLPFTYDDIKNIFTIGILRQIIFSNVNVYEGDVERLIVKLIELHHSDPVYSAANRACVIRADEMPLGGGRITLNDKPIGGYKYCFITTDAVVGVYNENPITPPEGVIPVKFAEFTVATGTWQYFGPFA